LRYVQAKLPERAQLAMPGAGRPALVGPALFRQHPLVYLAMLLALALIWFLYRTRAGLVLAQRGRNRPSRPMPWATRCVASGCWRVVAGGALCGLAGAYISVIYTPLWVEGMVAGKGWIALALTTFATWRPARVLLGAYLFGGVTMLQFHLQGDRRRDSQPVPDHAALPRHHRGAGADFPQPALDPCQHASFYRQAVLSRS